MSTGGRQYEFTGDENKLIGGMAHRMSWVGIFFIIVGVLNLLAAVFLLVAIYRHQVPAEWVSTLPEEAQKSFRETKLPENTQLWGFVINAAVGGLIYLLIGVWTRGAAVSFRQIVDTAGSDISHLMNALASLNKMYTLMYTLLVIAVLLFLVGLGLALWTQFGG